jgi:hypothetical protein
MNYDKNEMYRHTVSAVSASHEARGGPPEHAKQQAQIAQIEAQIAIAMALTNIVDAMRESACPHGTIALFGARCHGCDSI